MIRKDAKIYCCEDISKIENYKQALNAKTTWDVHHKREITENKTSQQLIDESLYFNRPANELIFLSRKEHIRIHREHNLHALDNWIKAGSDATRNVPKTEDHKQKLSESLKEYFKTHEHWNKGRTISDEIRRKISDTINKKHAKHEIIFSDDARKRCSDAGKKAANIKKCYIDENGDEVWMRPSLKAKWHPNWKLKE